MVTIVVCNQKGGVGKTSVATNLIGGFDYHFPEKKKLAIDLDPQGHTTFILHKDPNELFPDDLESDKSVYRLFQKEPYQETDIIHRTRNQNIDIVPSNITLFRAQQDSAITKKRTRVKNFLKLIENV